MCYGWIFKGVKHDKRKDDTSLNICRVPPLLEEACKPDAVRNVASDNDGSECNKYVVTEKNESNYGSVKTSSPSGMLVLMIMLFIFGVDYIY